MPAIKPSSIRDLKDRIGIFDVVSREVTLKRAGSNYKGLSPFTNEKTPSFFISPDKGIYKCFSTGNAGDIISFVMETERLNFVEAVEELAKRFSIELEYEEGGRPREDRSLRQELFELHRAIAVAVAVRLYLGRTLRAAAAERGLDARQRRRGRPWHSRGGHRVYQDAHIVPTPWMKRSASRGRETTRPLLLLCR